MQRTPGTAEANLIKAEDKVIDQLYRDHCAGMQISVMRIPELFKMARAMLRQGRPRTQIGDAMVAFIQNTM